ncbi:MAG: transketolase family protein [Oscillospiraceae bacterium]|nr:transketolase family protein [Oscillospiraceae bacterium]
MRMIPPRDGYGKALLRLCAEDSRIVVLDADVAKSTRTIWVKEQFPASFIDMGVSEQDMIGTAAGLAMTGMIPYASTYSAFLTGRAYDQIRSAVCHDNLNVKMAGAHAGFSVGPEGAIHQSLEDVAMMRVLPNMAVVVPCDALQVEKAVYAIRDVPGPCFVRFGREAAPVVTDADTPFEPGVARLIRDGGDVAIFANGIMVYEAIKAGEMLAVRGYTALIADIHTVKPLDAAFILSAAEKTGAVVTAEEHQKSGGLGGAVAELLSENAPAPVMRVGTDDIYGESGSPEDLMRKYGLTAEQIVASALAAMAMKRRG